MSMKINVHKQTTWYGNKWSVTSNGSWSFYFERFLNELQLLGVCYMFQNICKNEFPNQTDIEFQLKTNSSLLSVLPFINSSVCPVDCIYNFTGQSHNTRQLFKQILVILNSKDFPIKDKNHQLLFLDCL